MSDPLRGHFAALFALCLTGCAGQAPTARSSASVLPLRTLQLYETGVGYFERSGKLSPDSTMVLPVPAGHLDDALKTLVVLGPDGKVSVTGLEFASSVSQGMARSLAGLPASGTKPIEYRDLLVGLKGASVEVRLKKGSVTGRLIDVLDPEPATAPAEAESGDGKDTKKSEPAPRPDLTLLLLGEDGEIRRIDAANVESVRPLDAAFSARLGSSLDALSVRGAQTQRSLRLLGSSVHDVTLGYVAEAPIWRSTYRVVLDEGADRGALQGWALLHNDTDEAWKSVRVTLVNGRPDSFLFPLAAPRYARRELAEPDEKLSTVPQLLDRTVDQMWGDNLDEEETTGSGSGTGYGYGSGYGRVGGSHRTSAPKVRMGATSVVSSRSALSVGNLASLAPAEGVESGALFSYTLAAPVDLRAHGSSLVPFVAGPITARRVTWFGSPGAPGRSALRFTNSTAQTLPPGPIAIYERGGFAGEAALERLKPSKRQFLEFGADLDVEIEQSKREAKDETQSVGISEEGVLFEDYLRTHDRVYVAKNRSGSARAAYLVLNVDRNSKVEGADELDWHVESGRPLAVFVLAAHSAPERSLHIVEGLRRATNGNNVDSHELEQLAAAAALPPSSRAILVEAQARAKEAEAVVAEQQALTTETAELDADLERLREDLKALGDKAAAPGGANPLIARVVRAEDRKDAIRKRQKVLEAAVAERRKAALAVLKRLPIVK